MPLLPGLLWAGVVLSVRVSSVGQIEICNDFLKLKPFHCVQTNDWYQIESFLLDKNTRNRLTVWEKSIAILYTIQFWANKLTLTDL